MIDEPSRGNNDTHNERKDSDKKIDQSRPVLGGSIKLAPASNASTSPKNMEKDGECCDSPSKSDGGSDMKKGANPANPAAPKNPGC